MLLSAAATEDKEKTEPVVYVLVRSRPYFVRVRRRDITVAEDSAVVQLRGVTSSPPPSPPHHTSATNCRDTRRR